MKHYCQGKEVQENCCKPHVDHSEYKYVWRCERCGRYFCGWLHSWVSKLGVNVVCEDCEVKNEKT